MSEPVRFNGLQYGRAHVRLVAAVGILASAAIATGGLASLFASEPATPKVEAGPTLGLVSPTTPAADTTLVLELRVREAELAAARARAALRNARQLGRDEQELETYERRLEQLGMSPLESLRRGLGAGSDAQLEPDPFGEPRLDDRDDGEQRHERERRSHLRAIAPPARKL
jgi:hypothetical protein